MAGRYRRMHEAASDITRQRQELRIMAPRYCPVAQKTLVLVARRQASAWDKISFGKSSRGLEAALARQEPMVSNPKLTPIKSSPPARLDSWKEIAQHLGREVRTVQRWEKTDGLPVRRLFHEKRGSVFAYTADIDAWATARTLDPAPAAAPAVRRPHLYLAAVAAVLVAAGIAFFSLRSAKTSARNSEANGLAKVSGPAKEAYLQGIYYLNRGSGEDLRESVRYLKTAEAADPKFAGASAKLASAYLHLEMDGHQAPSEVLPLAKAAAERAIREDSSIAESHNVLAQLLAYHEWNWKGADEEFHRALSLDPNSASGHADYAQFLGLMGRADESIREGQRAVELEPLSALLRSNLAWYYYWAHRYDEAVVISRTVLASEPKFGSAQACVVHSLMVQQRWKEARTELVQQQKTAGVDIAALGLNDLSPERALHRYHEARLASMNKALLKSSGSEYVSLYTRGMMLGILHRKAELHALLQQSVVRHETIVLAFNVDPLFDEYRGYPEFSALMRSVGLPRPTSTAGAPRAGP